jgi:hypothetical protein
VEDAGIGRVPIMQPIGVDAIESKQVLEGANETLLIDYGSHRKCTVDVEHDEVHEKAV